MDEPKVWWYALPGVVCALVGFFFAQSLAFPKNIILSLAAGFFVSSLIFSIVSLRTSGASFAKVALLFLTSIIVGTIPLAVLIGKNPVKAIEIFFILCGIASLLIGYYLEKKEREKELKEPSLSPR